MTVPDEHPAVFPTQPGSGALDVQAVAGQSAATTVRSASPLKLLVPRSRGPSVWAFTSNFGGGLVAGDQTRLDVTLDPNTRCFLGTQAATKVYRNPRRQPCGHVTRARLGAGSLLVLAPDPVQLFAESSYTQHQEFWLKPDASLVLLDWFTAGRTARDERWQFRRFQTRNVVRSDGSDGSDGSVRSNEGAPEFLDALTLSDADALIASPHRTGRYNCFATLLLWGPAVGSVAETILADISRQGVSRQPPLLASASPVQQGAVLRLAGEEVEAVGRELRRHLAPLSRLLGDDPWARKW